MVSHTFWMHLREVNSLPRPSGQTGIQPLPALPYIVMSLVFLSGHEHSVLVPVWGEGGQQRGCLLYVHLAMSPVWAAFRIPACH